MGIISSLEWASAEITDAHLFFLSSNQFQLLNQPRAFTPFIDHEKDIADIYADATLQIRFKSDITTHRLPVTVESKSNQTGVLIEYRATGITTRDIIVREEAQLQVRNHGYEPDPVSPVVPRTHRSSGPLSLGYLYPLSNNCTMRHHKDDTLR